MADHYLEKVFLYLDIKTRIHFLATSAHSSL